MSWSYSPVNLGKRGLDYIRLLIGDTFSGDQQLQDEEINMFLTTRSSPLGVAAECCRALAAKFSRTVDQKAGQSETKFSQMAKAYMQMALQFEQKAALAGAAAPYAGGISVTDMMNQELNTDRVPPVFTIGMTDNYLPVATGNETETMDQVSSGTENR